MPVPYHTQRISLDLQPAFTTFEALQFDSVVANHMHDELSYTGDSMKI